MSKFINKAMLIENIKLYWVVPALSLLAYLLFMIFPLFGADASDPWGRTRQMMDIISMQNSIMIISIIAVPAVVVLFITGQFFSKRRATALYSFPITKDQMFFTNVLSGIVLILAPLVLVGLLLFIPVRFPETITNDHDRWFWSAASWTQFDRWLTPGTLINPPLQVLALILRITIGKLFFFAVFKLAFTLAGHKVIAILLAAVMPFIAIGLYALYVVLEAFYVFGASGAGELFELIARYTFPMAAFMENNAGTFPLHLYFWFSGFAIVLFAIAFLVNRKRKAERTGDSIVFTPVKNVLIFLVSLAMALFVTAFAAVFFNMWIFTSSVIIYYLGLVIGFTVGFVVGQMIAEKTLAIGHKLKTFPIFAGVAVGLYVVMLICTQFIATPIINRLPQQETVAEVWFTHWIPAERDRGGIWAHRPLTDPSDIQAVLDIHQETIDNKPFIYGPWNQYNSHFHGITYVLHDGRQIRRRVVASWDTLEALGYHELQRQTQPVTWSWTHEQWEEYDRQQWELWNEEDEIRLEG